VNDLRDMTTTTHRKQLHELSQREQEVVESVFQSEGREWALAHIDLILEQARSVGHL